ncbi:MAG: hypothetical protein RL038_980 [Actinomycetota bacterium]|jgi:predicted amidohydrolase
MAKVSIWQIDCSDSESAAERKARVLTALPQLLGNCDLLVLPELWLSGAFNLSGIPESADLVDSDFLSQLQALVDDSSAELHAGTFPIRTVSDSARFTNTALLFRPNQPCISYRKQHLFGFAGGETTLMNASNDVVVLDSAIGKSGLATCYDLRFPELFRVLVDAKADNFLIPAGWPTSRILHWQVLLQARAIENQAVVVGANSCGMNGDVELGGNSMIISATGEILANAGASEEVLSTEVDLAETVKWRNDFPVLKDRRSL